MKQPQAKILPFKKRCTPQQGSKEPEKLEPVVPHAHDEHHLHSHAGDQAYGPYGD